MLLVALATAVIAGGATTAAVLLDGGSGGHPPGSGGSAGASSYTASGPWRLKIINDGGAADGCAVTLTDAQSGKTIWQNQGMYGTQIYQFNQTGSFRWQVNDSRSCGIVNLAGSGDAKLPFSWGQYGDTDAFATSARVTVRVSDYQGNSSCKITLRDPADGQVLESKSATPGQDNDTVTLDAAGRSTAYLSQLLCFVQVSSAA